MQKERKWKEKKIEKNHLLVVGIYIYTYMHISLNVEIRRVRFLF